MAIDRKRGQRGDGGGDEGGNGGTGGGEFRSSTEVRTALVQLQKGITAVQYSVVDGQAIVEGDIILGPADLVEQSTADAQEGGIFTEAVVVTGTHRRWANCRIPYTIDPNLPNQQRVTDAIAHWESRTNYRFPRRTTEADYITFRPAGGCSSMVGRQGGQQFVNLADGCSMGSTIHEIGHVVGLWHEQSREDRDSFVRIQWENIQPGKEHNFNQHITDGDDVGPYDYGSIMHYPRKAFSKNGLDTIVPTNPASATIGQRTALSPGDIAAANSICSGGVTKRPIDDPVTRKELVKDIRLDTRKELINDTIKERIKDIALDPVKGRDPIDPRGPVKRDQVLTARGGAIARVAGRGAAPLTVAAAHQAPAADRGGSEEATNHAMQLDAQLQALAEALADAQATVTSLQQQYDETQALLNQLLDQHDPQG